MELTVILFTLLSIDGYHCRECQNNYYWDSVLTICTRCDAHCYTDFIETTTSGHICATSDQCVYHYQQISKHLCNGSFVYNPVKNICQNCVDCHSQVELVLNFKTGSICNKTCSHFQTQSNTKTAFHQLSRVLNITISLGVTICIVALFTCLVCLIYRLHKSCPKVRKTYNTMVIEETASLPLRNGGFSVAVMPNNIDVHFENKLNQHCRVHGGDKDGEQYDGLNSQVVQSYSVSSTSVHLDFEENYTDALDLDNTSKGEDMQVNNATDKSNDRYTIDTCIQETNQTVERYAPFCSNPSKYRSHQALTAATSLLVTPSLEVTEHHPCNTGLSRESNSDSNLGLVSILSSTESIDCHPVQPRHESEDSSYGTGIYSDYSNSLDNKKRSRYNSESSESEYDFRSTHFQADDKNVGDEPHIKNKNEHGFETANEIEFLPKNLKHIQNIQQIMQDLAKEEWVRRLISNGKFVKVTVGQLDVVNAAILVEKISGLSRNQYECVL